MVDGAADLDGPADPLGPGGDVPGDHVGVAANRFGLGPVGWGRVRVSAQHLGELDDSFVLTEVHRQQRREDHCPRLG